MWDAQIELFKIMKPPLRPHASEVTLVEDVAASLAAAGQIDDFHVLVLGLTEEIIQINWPRGTILTAVDQSENMIRHFWPGDIPGRRTVVHANWFDMPFRESSFHLIVGDGVFNFMSYPEGFRHFFNTLWPYLCAGGQICVRVFTQLTTPEKPGRLLQEFHRSQLVNYYEFNYRLATSLQETIKGGFDGTKETLDRYLVTHGIDLSEFYAKSGHTPPDIPPLQRQKTDERYRIFYPTEAEFLEQCGPQFELVRKLNGTHSLAHRTPIFVLRRVDQPGGVNA